MQHTTPRKAELLLLVQGGHLVEVISGARFPAQSMRSRRQRPRAPVDGFRRGGAQL
jgi:hypothetical protein